MEKRKVHLIQAMVSGFCFLLLDQLAKWYALHSPIFTFYLVKPFFGWELLLNRGVAFGLPISNWILVTITPFILIFLVLFLSKKYSEPKTNTLLYYGLCFILFGALSNYIDRFLIAATIDYFRIVYSVINIADISIVLGVILLLICDVHKST